MKLCGFEIGADRPFFLIAGPCVVESEGMVLDIAGRMQEITRELGIPYIFKASYDKANRSSKASPHAAARSIIHRNAMSESPESG